MNFDRYDDWFVHFIEAECRTTIRRRTRFIRALPQRGGFPNVRLPLQP
jgi:hypothetical protein